MVEKLQPSSDFNATCCAIAWDIVQNSQKTDDRMTAPQKAHLTRRVALILAKGKDPAEDQSDSKK